MDSIFSKYLQKERLKSLYPQDIALIIINYAADIKSERYFSLMHKATGKGVTYDLLDIFGINYKHYTSKLYFMPSNIDNFRYNPESKNLSKIRCIESYESRNKVMIDKFCLEDDEDYAQLLLISNLKVKRLMCIKDFGVVIDKNNFPYLTELIFDTSNYKCDLINLPDSLKYLHFVNKNTYSTNLIENLPDTLEKLIIIGDLNIKRYPKELRELTITNVNHKYENPELPKSLKYFNISFIPPNNKFPQLPYGLTHCVNLTNKEIDYPTSLVYLECVANTNINLDHLINLKHLVINERGKIISLSMPPNLEIIHFQGEISFTVKIEYPKSLKYVIVDEDDEEKSQFYEDLPKNVIRVRHDSKLLKSIPLNVYKYKSKYEKTICICDIEYGSYKIINLGKN